MQILIVGFLTIGMLLTQVLMGGFSLLFGIPGYSLIAVAALMGVFLSFRRIHPGARKAPLISALALTGYVVWRCLNSPVEYLARADFFMVLASLAVYLLTACYLRTARERMWVIYALCGLSLLHVGAGLLQFVYGKQFMLLQLLPDGPILPRLFRPFYEERASGFYGCPNHLAGFLEALAMLMLAGVLLGRSKVTGRILYGYFLIVCLTGIALTASRGGYMSTIFGLVVFIALSLWVLRKLRKDQFWMGLIASVVLVAGVIGGGVMMMSRSALLERRMGDINDPQNVRLLLWHAAIQQYHLSPVIGTGAGTYLYYGRQFRAETLQRDPVHVHNDYLELLAEYGNVGASLTGIFILAHLWSGWRGASAIVHRRLKPARRRFSDELALTAGSLAAIATLLLHSVVDFNFHIPGNTLFYAFLFGILASPTSDPQIVPERTPRMLWPVRLALPALGGVILVMGIPLLRGEFHAEWARIQLRNLMCMDAASTLQRSAHLLATSLGSGLPTPALGVSQDWSQDLVRSFYLPETLRHAEAGLAVEKKNPNLYYYQGEARRYLAVYLTEIDPVTGQPWKTGRMAKYMELQGLAGDAFSDGLRYFPQDVRLQLKLAQVLDSLGLVEQSEGIYVTALAADPNLAEIYARYGAHHFQRRKLLRAEAYYHRALRFLDGNEIAVEGLKDIAFLRAKAKDQNYIDQFGDPLENFEMEPPTEEDEKRGATLHE